MSNNAADNPQHNPNMDLWWSVFITDPSKTKPITGKAYKGTSPNPYWLVQRATETWGPCGKGWGIEIISEKFQPCNAETMLHSAHIRLWYMDGGEKCSVEQVGGTMAMYKTSTAKMVYDEDAPKKSVTDAFVKAMSYLGFCGDIFSGLWDDWKYQEMAAQHYQQKAQQQAAQQNQQQHASGIGRTDKELAADLQQALAAIDQAPDESELNRAYYYFKGTKHEQTIIKACKAKKDREGWSE